MHKLLASIHKEWLLMYRDLGGLAILFIMPLVLVVTVTLIQDSSFKELGKEKIQIILVDQDRGVISESIQQNLNDIGNLQIITKESEQEAKDLVNKGAYKLAFVIPENLSLDLENKVNTNVEGVLTKLGLSEGNNPEGVAPEQIEIKLYFDPAVQGNFKSSVKSGIDKMISQIESRFIYSAFQNRIAPDEEPFVFDSEDFIVFTEISPTEDEFIPNSVQHNIPAWTLFAIFFIIVPLSINMVKEKNQGTFIRQRTQPISYMTILGGKTIIYLGVCLIQFTLILLLGLYLFPALGLPHLDISGRLLNLYIVAFFAGLSAIGLGLLLGTLAKTQEQSAPFGATFVVILAAVGGVWVPVFAMPSVMQVLSHISPINWVLEAFYHVFLRNSVFLEILPDISLLFLFFLATTSMAIWFNERKIAL